jgi:predicted TIM-barrel fold metal-dependent hydrolase
MTPVVDSHTHLFAPDRTRYPLADPRAAYRPLTDGSVELLRREMDAASQQQYPFADVHWMARRIVDAFGADRCMYGSNFPTAQYNPKVDYRQAVRLFAEALDLTDDERAWVLGGTAAKLWRWR